MAPNFVPLLTDYSASIDGAAGRTIGRIIDGIEGKHPMSWVREAKDGVGRF